MHEIDEQGWLITECAGKALKQLSTFYSDGTVHMTLEFEDATELSLSLETRPFVGIETQRIARGDVTEIRACVPKRACESRQ